MKKSFLILGLLFSFFAHSQGKIVVKGSGGIDGSGANLNAIGIYLPETYGAVGDGTTDDHLAFQACFDAAPEGSTIRLASDKSYKITTAVTVEKSLHITGGAYKTAQLTSNADNDIFLLEADNITIENIDFTFTGTRSDGAAIHGINTESSPAYSTTIRNCYFEGAFVAIKHEASFHLKVNYCFFFESWSRDMIIENDRNTDIGDQDISGNFFSGGYTHAPIISVEYNSGGGMRVVNNKFNWSGGTGIRYEALISVNMAAGTNDFIATGNSFENYTVRAIEIATYGTFGNITITGNQFAAYVTSPLADIEITGCKHISIQSNTFSYSGNTSIVLNDCEDVTLGNTYSSAYTTEVELNSCTNVINYNSGSSSLTTEQVQDIVGSMFNTTHTGVTVTYDDATGKIAIDTGAVVDPAPDLPGASLVLDADDVVVDGSNNVTEWHDQTGNFIKNTDATENFFVPINGSPILIDDDADLGNVVYTDGVNDVLWALNTDLANDNTITIAVVCKNGGSQFFGNRINYSSTGTWWMAGQASSEVGSTYENFDGDASSDPVIVVFTISPTAVFMHVNGVLTDSNTGSFSVGNTNAGGGLMLGGYYYSSAFHGFSSARVAELRIYPTSLNDTDRGILETHLSTKHGITLP